jgi:hypothetical protein
VWTNWRCAVLKTILAQSVSLVVFLGSEIRCVVAMESVKEVELARGMANALATRNTGVNSVINAVGITTRASETKQNYYVRRVTRHVRVTVLDQGPRAAPSARVGSI